MHKTIAKIDKFHQTRSGKLTFAAIEIALAYIVISQAIDTGSLWQWLAGLLLFIGGLNNLVRIAYRQVKTDAKGKAKER